ncbi:MAG: D-serine ammonia-lyase [Candidatus Lokiarchaeota archaeon]|nr:D-serine ammonia-lyase [Candidatus Harpocratesius repetitus]
MNENTLIDGVSLKVWKEKVPLLEPLMKFREIFWFNPRLQRLNFVKEQIDKKGFSLKEILKAQSLWDRFSPLFQELFPETEKTKGKIQSSLFEIDKIKEKLQNIGNTSIIGRVFAKCDNDLAIAGSIKARGGIFEVLKITDRLLQDKWRFNENSSYKTISEQKFRNFFEKYTISVGSTGNLGYSIGIIANKLGFKTKIYMSSDAKEWKKQKLRSLGINIIEIQGDYNEAVKIGRNEASNDPTVFFIDDERSSNLFIGYATAALELKNQLNQQKILVDEDHPLFVYLPCGVGTSPGGITTGLKMLYGDNVHCIFTEPVACPSMLLGLLTEKHHEISPKMFGISCETLADGLACPSPSEFVGRLVEPLITGIYTVTEQDLLGLLSLIWDSEKIKIEPSSSGVILGPVHLYQAERYSNYLKNHSILDKMKNSTHIIWLSGGKHLPKNIWEQHYKKGCDTELYQLCSK